MGTTSIGTYNRLHNLTTGLTIPSKTNFSQGYDVGVFDPGGLLNTTTGSTSYLSAKDLI